MSTSLEGHADLRPASEESAAAIERTRHLLHEAVVLLDSEDDEKLVIAYEHASECADNIARALWFLRKMERERSTSAA